MTDKLAELVSKAERIGVIGSPSSTTELALDIMARAVNKKLVGELAVFRYLQDNNRSYIKLLTLYGANCIDEFVTLTPRLKEFIFRKNQLHRKIKYDQ